MKDKLNSEPLGKVDSKMITAIINGVVKLAPLVASWFGKGKGGADTWSGWDWPTKTQYVQEGIIVAKEAIRQGKATTIEQTLQVLIAQVELDESWEYWKQRNQRFIPMINQAQAEINAEMAKGNNLASIVSGKFLLWTMALSVIGYGVYFIITKRKNP